MTKSIKQDVFSGGIKNIIILIIVSFLSLTGSLIISEIYGVTKIAGILFGVWFLTSMFISSSLFALQSVVGSKCFNLWWKIIFWSSFCWSIGILFMLCPPFNYGKVIFGIYLSMFSTLGLMIALTGDYINKKKKKCNNESKNT